MRIEPGLIPVNGWGKLHPRKDPTSYHPLSDHCIDVAAVGEALLCLPTWKKRFEHIAGTELTTETRATLTRIIALHDIGKANTHFQNKCLGGDVPTAGHVEPGAALLARIGFREEELCAPISRLIDPYGDSALLLLRAALSHHGTPIRENDPFTHSMWKPASSYNPADCLSHLATEIRRGTPNCVSLPEYKNEVYHFFAGLVMLADWLGSNTDFFPYRTDEVQDRWVFAREVAARLLHNMALDLPQTTRNIQHALTPSQLLGTPQAQWRVIQDSIFHFPVDNKVSSTVLIEAETGSGKTEAAFIHFIRLLSHGCVDGMVFTVPTRAAARQLHSRIVQLSRNIWGDEAPTVVLGVPGYCRVDNVNAVARLPNYEVLWPDVVTKEETWAAEAPKRFLVAPILVTTIDQVSLSTLKISHAHLRGVALCRQLLVVDEVHASDFYMMQLLQRVLKRQRLVGNHTLLMSATLSGHASGELLGTPKHGVSLPDAVRRMYPLVQYTKESTVLIERETVWSLPMKSWPTESKQIYVAPGPDSADIDAIANLAVRCLRLGARVLVLRNTVKTCVATQQQIETIINDNVKDVFSVRNVLAPHHARYAAEDRNSLDAALELRVKQNRPFLVVATQTVEQSLDIDFDILLTDLCPVDVLLQRIGRIHRHDRQRPAGFERAHCVVFKPNGDMIDRIRTDGTVSTVDSYGVGTVYSDLRVLQLTWDQVSASTVWVIPQQNREKIEHALHPDALAELEKSHNKWRMHVAALLGTTRAQHSLANTSSFAWTDELNPFPYDEHMVTRLGEHDRIVQFRQSFISPFGNSIDQLKIPGWFVVGIEDDAFVDVVAHTTDGVTVFTISETTFRYDRFGLAKQ